MKNKQMFLSLSSFSVSLSRSLSLQHMLLIDEVKSSIGKIRSARKCIHDLGKTSIFEQGFPIETTFEYFKGRHLWSEVVSTRRTSNKKEERDTYL